jgi:pSer/pThr/pTyr-binding forkhead associated (FHA) protein
MSKATVVPSLKSSHWPILLPIADQKHMPKFPVAGTAWLAGSRTQAQIVLKSRLVSRSHALLINDLGESYIRDLASTNGIYLNNQPVREARLSDGDILNIGRFQFICYSGFPSELDEDPQDIFDAELQVEGTDRVAPIRLRSVLIGRRDKCELKLDDAGASQVHAIIYRCDGRRYVRDLNSQSGTFLNHQRIRDAEVRPGDMIRIGETILRYERCEDAAGSWMPDIAVEQAMPWRLADEDDNPVDPMTDSSLERALLAAQEMKISPEPNAPRRARRQVILKSDHGPKLPPGRQDSESFDTVSDILPGVDEGALPGNVLDNLDSQMWDEGPTPRNVDLPQAAPRVDANLSGDSDEPKIAIEHMADPVGAEKDDQVADLLEDGFFRGAGL